VPQDVPKDYALAMTWFGKAAEHGQAHAQAFLGLMYRDGQSVPQDYVRAHMWFTLAASRFGASASEKQAAAEANKDRDEISAKMTAAQIAEAQKLAREWKPAPRK
jgi:TPR repeat protein